MRPSLQFIILILVAVAAALPAPAAAQTPPRPPATQRVYIDFDLLVADALGPFGETTDGAGGFQLAARFVPSPASRIAYRLDGGVMIYGDESRDVCFPPPIGCRIGTTVTTTNGISYMGIGPELLLAGQRAYLFGTAGFSSFSTTSSLSGAGYAGAPGFLTENYGDAVFSARFGGGTRLRIGGTYRPLFLDIGAEYHHNGVASYLREGDIIDSPDGSITLLPNRTEANLYSVRVGVSFAASSSRPRQNPSF